MPGIFKQEDGVKVYIPISQEQYNEMIENENFENRDEILRAIYSETSRSFGGILKINGGKPAKRNFEGYEEYIKQFREKLREKVLNILVKNKEQKICQFMQVHTIQ